MHGQMCWLPRLGGNGEKILHLRTAPNQPWQPYRTFPEVVPDYAIPGGSKGWATYQKLLLAGWTLVSTAQAQASLIVQEKKTA
ncbi:MAG: hypothetical protein HXY43_15315 [Fischerella sp.]|jgi:hypothetical protein|uniref:hypothetical protein n=1 Tax=unclassified Fischerella TaxID=494603 RepID=UPI00047C55C2|nr:MULTISPECIES: hypothetical protein [unclassified Fischerella]NWF60585.1 hypothetical protein [Fischerella sp.]